MTVGLPVAAQEHRGGIYVRQRTDALVRHSQGNISKSPGGQIMAEVQVATVRNQVTFPLFTDFEDFSVKPANHLEKFVNAMLD